MSSTAQLDWIPAKQTILGSDPASTLYAEVSIWFNKLELFRREEDERMFQSEPTDDDKKIHHTLLLRLIADGEHLLTLLDQSGGLISNREKIKIEDVRAAVEGLHDTYRGWHGGIPFERRRQLLTEIFGDVA